MLSDYNFLKPINVGNISSLYGLHEKLLNNLLKRFDMGNIKDFFVYFSEPWAQILYHDSFAQLRRRIKEILRTTFVSLLILIFQNKTSNIYGRVYR